MTPLPLYETGRFYVCAAAKRKGKDMGFEVYQNDVTHSVRCAIVGFTGSKGLRRAMAEADRRQSEMESYQRAVARSVS